MNRGLFLVEGLFTLVAIALLVTLLLRPRIKAGRQISRLRRELADLEAERADGLDSTSYAMRRAALAETSLQAVAAPAPYRHSPIYAALVVSMVGSAGTSYGYRTLYAPPQPLRAPESANALSSLPAEAAHLLSSLPTGTGSAAPDHGGDMQAAIAHLANKLREHPDDAQGWALLGRTYRATQHYSEARDAFKHAMDAAPGDLGFAREYAAAETPTTANAADPEACPVDDGKACDTQRVQ